MKKNNKGMTLIEVIISIALIAIIIIFIMNLFLSVREDEAESKEESLLKSNQALIVKDIHTDFLERELVGIEPCNDTTDRNLVTSLNQSFAINGGSNCLKLIYNKAKGPDNIGYLIYYSFGPTNDKTHVVGYRRGNKSIVRKTDLPPTETGTATVSCNATLCTLEINLPVISEKGDNYDINLSYLANANFSATNHNSAWYKFNIVKN